MVLFFVKLLCFVAFTLAMKSQKSWIQRKLSFFSFLCICNHRRVREYKAEVENLLIVKTIRFFLADSNFAIYTAVCLLTGFSDTVMKKKGFERLVFSVKKKNDSEVDCFGKPEISLSSHRKPSESWLCFIFQSFMFFNLWISSGRFFNFELSKRLLTIWKTLGTSFDYLPFHIKKWNFLFHV